jgi:hypothetical protein
VRTATCAVYRDAEHETWAANGYAVATSGGYACTLVNPVNISKRDAGDCQLEVIQAIRGTTARPLTDADEFPQSSYCR